MENEVGNLDRGLRLRIAIRDWGMGIGIGDWGLGIGDWDLGLEIEISN